MVHCEADNSQEQWRAITDRPGYEVSNIGNVRRSELKDNYGRIWEPPTTVNPFLTGSPRWHITRYWEVTLRDVTQKGRKANRHRHKIHHLVAEAFIGPRPAGMVICHNNGDPLDNRVENLRYDTQANNIADMYEHRGGHPNSQLTTCLNGHDITNPDNVYANSKGRKCKTCQRKRAKERHARLKAEREAKAS